MSHNETNQILLSPDELEMAMARGRKLRSEAYRSVVRSLFAPLSRLVRSAGENAAKDADAKRTFVKVA